MAGLLRRHLKDISVGLLCQDEREKERFIIFFCKWFLIFEVVNDVLWIVVCLADRSIQIKLLFDLWLDSRTMPLESSRPPCWQVIALLLFGHQRPFFYFLFFYIQPARKW